MIPFIDNRTLAERADDEAAMILNFSRECNRTGSTDTCEAWQLLRGAADMLRQCAGQSPFSAEEWEEEDVPDGEDV